MSQGLASDANDTMDKGLGWYIGVGKVYGLTRCLWGTRAHRQLVDYGTIDKGKVALLHGI